MFARVNTLYLSLVLALCASAASVSVRTDGGSAIDCNANSGTQQCCDSLANVTDPIVSALAGLLGIDINSLTAQVGLSCTPIAGATQCNSQALCCTGNTIGGLITIGCSPLNVGL